MKPLTSIPRKRSWFKAVAARNRCHLKIKRYSGFSLIELFISLSIGTFIILGTSNLYLHSRAAFLAQEYSGQLAENGRIASEIMRNTIQKAGYWGCSGTEDFPVQNHLDLDRGLKNADGSQQNPNQPDYGQTDFQAIHGKRSGPDYDTDEITALYAIDEKAAQVMSIESGIDDINKQASLNLHARIRVDSIDDLEPGDLVAISDCSQADIFRISDVNQGQKEIGIKACSTCSRSYANNAKILKLEQTRFYISTGANGEPALYSSSNGNSGVELIEGVEKLRIYYGTDRDKDGAVDQYVLPEVIDDSCVQSANQDCWGYIRSVRISLLLRTIENNLAQQSLPYHYDGKQFKTNDGRLRREFVTTVALNNYR